VLDPARLQVFMVGPNGLSSDQEHSQLPQKLTSLVSQAYDSHTLPSSFVANFSQNALRSCIGGDGGISRILGCPVMSMSATESSYLFSFTHGPLGYDVDTNAAITVAISALTMMEGSIWRNVRGAGLAYGTSIDHDVFAGLIKLDIYRSSHPSAALLQCRPLSMHSSMATLTKKLLPVPVAAAFTKQLDNAALLQVPAPPLFTTPCEVSVVIMR